MAVTWYVQYNQKLQYDGYTTAKKFWRGPSFISLHLSSWTNTVYSYLAIYRYCTVHTTTFLATVQS
jgi:hypothetical protein